MKHINVVFTEEELDELRKEADNAARYGEDVNVRRVDVTDKDVAGFGEDPSE
jgi:predicted lipid-binding transport protein (Tim44 family)